MNHEVELSREARAYLRRLDQRSRQRIARRIEQIAAEPRGRHSKLLAGPSGNHSARVGIWRIVFKIDDQARTVSITDIGPRGQIYRNL